MQGKVVCILLCEQDNWICLLSSFTLLALRHSSWNEINLWCWVYWTHTLHCALSHNQRYNMTWPWQSKVQQQTSPFLIIEKRRERETERERRKEKMMMMTMTIMMIAIRKQIKGYCRLTGRFISNDRAYKVQYLLYLKSYKKWKHWPTRNFANSLIEKITLHSQNF
jgi:hypothetical protein